jgi:hypothetical protein
MKPIKKFSLIKSEESELLESMKANHGEMAVDLAKKLGYNSLEEIAKEKKILTKLESLLKALPKKFNVSEDDSKEIEDEVVAKGEPKSLEDMEGEKEGELDTEEEELETEEEELETEEEDDTEEEELETDEEEDETEEEELETEEEDDTEEEEDDTEEEEMPKATRRIKTFEEFIQEKEETINKNVSYRDDEDEEDYAEPVAASVVNEENIAMRPSVERLLKQKGYDPIFQTIDKSKRDFKRLGYTKGEIEETLFDMFGNIDPKIVKKIKESFEHLNEAEIKSDKDFEEYATTVLKNAFGDEFDEAKAKEVIDGLKSKYSGDYGAMVGALQSSLG